MFPSLSAHIPARRYSCFRLFFPRVFLYIYRRSCIYIYAGVHVPLYKRCAGLEGRATMTVSDDRRSLSRPRQVAHCQSALHASVYTDFLTNQCFHAHVTWTVSWNCPCSKMDIMKICLQIHAWFLTCVFQVCNFHVQLFFPEKVGTRMYLSTETCVYE